jgi:hypothetical protein
MIARTVNAAAQLTEGDEAADTLQKALKVRLSQMWYDKLGWDDKPADDHNTKSLRHTAVAMQIGGESSEAIAEALKRFEAAKDLQDIQAELRSTIMVAAGRHGGDKAIQRLLAAYDSAAPDVQLDITGGLTSTRDPKTASMIIGKALGPKGFVRAQDVMRWIAQFLRNYYTRVIMWDYITHEWSWIVDVMGRGKQFDYFPIYCAGVITTEAWAKKYHEFFEPKRDMDILKQNIAVGYSDIDARVAWRKRDEKAIRDWLTTQNKA